jgi:hypothetical protein
MFRAGVGGNSPGTPSGGDAQDEGPGLALASSTERLDLGRLAPKNGRPEPRILLVEHSSADAEARWSRALELLLEAGIATTTHIDGDDGGGR